MTNTTDRRTKPRVWCVAAILFGIGVSACAGVDVLRLTDRTFPPKASADDVEILERKPAASYTALAELSMTSDASGLETMQCKIVKKAAALGADAVIFSKPDVRVKHEVAYDWSNYSPWGYESPYYYGPWVGYGGPYGASGASPVNAAMPYGVPYDITVNVLKGTAIRYGNGDGVGNGYHRRP